MQVKIGNKTVTCVITCKTTYWLHKKNLLFNKV